MRVKLFITLSCFAALVLLVVCSNNPSSSDGDDKKYMLEIQITPEVGGEVIRTFNRPTKGYTKGTEFNVIAKPNSGYTFAGWSGDLTSAKDTLKVVMNSDITLTATFKAATVTPPVVPEDTTGTGKPTVPGDTTGTAGGDTTSTPGDTVDTPTDPVTPPSYTLTVTANGGGTVTPAQGTYESGAQVTVTATAAEGYVFSVWSGASTSASPEITITMDGDKTLTANFTQVPTPQINYTLLATVSGTGGGTVSRNPDQPTYAPNTRVTVTATPNQGYEFTGWGEPEYKDNPMVIIMDGNKTLTANFSPVQTQPYTLTVKSSPESIFSSKTERHPNGTEVTIPKVEGETSDGHIFIGWTDETGKVIEKNTEAFSVIIDKDKTFTAHYGKYTVTIEIENDCEGSTVKITPDKKNFSKLLYYDSEEITAEAIPGRNCVFNSWTFQYENGISQQGGIANRREWPVDRNLILYPSFEQKEE
jgi:uncharacterized repeat protein (TIGR02543 family)